MTSEMRASGGKAATKVLRLEILRVTSLLSNGATLTSKLFPIEPFKVALW